MSEAETREAMMRRHAEIFGRLMAALPSVYSSERVKTLALIASYDAAEAAHYAERLG